MIDHRVANNIETGKALEEYFLANLEKGDIVRGPSGFQYVIVATHQTFFWAQSMGDPHATPITLFLNQMDSIK